MAKQWSVEEIMASLEAEAEVHRREAALHAEREAYHREKRAFHDQELAALTRRLDDFRSASSAALEVVKARSPLNAPADEGLDIGPASKPLLTKIVLALLDELGPRKPFGSAWLTTEVNRRHGHRLRTPVIQRQISDVLRRLTRQGRLEQVRVGKGRYEARFVRVE